MTGEPENLVLELLRQMRAENLAFQEEARASFADLRLAVAANGAEIGLLRKDAESIRQTVADLDTRLEIVEGRLNTIDGRLARIEKHTGLVKA